MIIMRARLGEPLPLLEKGRYGCESPNKRKTKKISLQDRLRALKYKLDH